MLYSRQNNLIRAKTLTQEEVMIEQSGYLKVLAAIDNGSVSRKQ